MKYARRLPACLTLLLAACGESTEPGGGGDRLDGNPDSPALTAIVLEPYRARRQDFTADHPDLPGVPISYNTIAVVPSVAATVGEINLVLEELDAEIVGGIPGVAAASPGILFLRLPIDGHAAMIAVERRLDDDPHFEFAVPDVLLASTTIPRPHVGLPAAWSWQQVPAGDNWGLEMIRAPQLWGLNRAITKQGTPAAVTLVADVGFASHPDLQFLNSPAHFDSHGTHVAGIIGATYDNAIGVDGVNPFARMLAESGIEETLFTSWGEAIISRMEERIRAQPDLRVINTSLGYNWVYPPNNQYIDAAHNEAAQRVAEDHGGILRRMLDGLAAAGVALPVWLTASGNDSGSPQVGDQVAVWASPMANAALFHSAANIIIVESVALGPDPAQGQTVRALSSNLGGHLSAPGVDIMSTDLAPPGYARLSGTSMATPHVAGLVGYLYALVPALPRPSLANNPIRDVLLANAVPAAGGARPRVDAFATALDLDRLLGGTAVLQMLTDFDDGTPDGNLRADAAGTLTPGDAHGDGRVDMSDFRRWRDWALQIHATGSHALDGQGHPAKLDLNGDGIVSAPADENRFPRGDLNGDGRLTIDGTARLVPGAINASVTDLQVLQHLFSDPDYQAADLPALILSGDIHMDASTCLNLAAVVSARVTATSGGGPEIVRTFVPGVPVRILTLAAPTTWSVRIDALNASGAVVTSVTLETTLAPGEDVHLRPICTGTPAPVITFTRVQTFAQARTFEAPACIDRDDFAPVTPVLSRVSRVVTCTSGALPSTATAQNAFSVSAMSGGTVTFNALGRGTLSGAQVGDHHVQVNLRFTIANGPAQFTISGSVSGSISAQTRFGQPQDVQIVVAIVSASGTTLQPTLTNLRILNGQPDQTVQVAKAGGLVPGEYTLVASVDAMDANSVGEFNVTLVLGP